METFPDGCRNGADLPGSLLVQIGLRQGDWPGTDVAGPDGVEEPAPWGSVEQLGAAAIRQCGDAGVNPV